MHRRNTACLLAMVLRCSVPLTPRAEDAAGCQDSPLVNCRVELVKQ
jgi:hypothetical protein